MKLSRPIRKLLVFLSISLLSAGAYAEFATMVGDTHNRAGGRSGTNYGSNARLFTYDPAGSERTSLLQFAMPAVEGAIQSAFLTIRLETLPSAGTLEVRRLLGAWDEDTVTYDTQPAVGAAVDGMRTLTNADVGTDVTIDVTPAVQAWYNAPATNFGFILVGTDGLRARFGSSDGPVSPTLEIMSEGPPVGSVLAWNGDAYVATPPSVVVNNSNADKMQPFIGMNYIIALQGIYPSRSGSEPFLGEIVMFGGNFAPRGWAFCDGRLLPISQNTALFSLLGTMYGGDGRTTFALPDLRGRAPIGIGSGPGLTPRAIGAKGGSERH